MAEVNTGVNRFWGEFGQVLAKKGIDDNHLRREWGQTPHMWRHVLIIKAFIPPAGNFFGPFSILKPS